MQSKFNQKTIDEYQLNAISYMEKFIMDMFSESFTNDIVKRSKYQYEHHKKIDKSKGITHDDVCDCQKEIDDDFVFEYLKPYESELLIIKNCFEGMIEKISDKELNPRILKDYLKSFRNNPDHFYEIFNKTPDFYDHWYDEDGRMIVTPNVTNKNKEEAFLSHYL